MTAIPWTYDERPNTRTTNVRLGVWLFLASEAMFFGSLFSAYVLLRTGSAAWPDGNEFLSISSAAANTALLIGSTATLFGGARSAGATRVRLLLSSVMSLAFIALKALEYRAEIGAGHGPAENLLLACWFVLTGVHVLHVAGGVLANLWVAAAVSANTAATAARLHALRLYWAFVDLVWFAILGGFYFI